MSLQDLWTTTQEGKVYARTGGPAAHADAAKAVLVHGMVVSSRYMVPTAQRLARLCRVYAIDLPGYGKSYKPARILSVGELADALIAWMDAIDIDRSHFIGNSFGCQIIAELAARYPKRVDRLVLQGPTVDPQARSVGKQILRLALNSMREPKSLGMISLLDYRAAGWHRARATMRLVLEDRIEDKLPHIQAPTLVVRGMRDPLVPSDWAKRIVELLPHGTLHEIEGAPHTINFSMPDEFVAAIAPFLRLPSSASNEPA